MIIKKPGFALGAVALLAFGDWAGSVLAAESEDALEEVVVTAEKRATNLQKTPISIQVYSGEELKKEGKKRIDEIMNGVVGVQTQGSQVGSSFYMRGVDAGGGGPPGGGPTQSAVAVLIDGVYQNRSEVVRGGTLDVSQVEVMRGTQSTTVGAGALSGAVSLISNNPVFEYQASGNVEVGNYKLLNTEGVLNVPLSSDQALRFAYSSNKRDGYISSGAGDSDLTNARLKYRWKLSDNLDAIVTASHQNIGGNGVSDGVLLYSGHWVPFSGQVAMTGCNPTTTTTYIATMGCPPLFVAVADGVTYKDRSNPWDDGYPANAWPNNPYRDTNIDSYSADINWETGIGKLTVTPSVQHATFMSTEPPRGTSFREQDQAQDTRQFEARLASDASSRIEWLVGAYYYYTNTTGTFHTLIMPGATGMDSCAVSDPLAYCHTWSDTRESSQTTESLYGSATYPVLDTLRLKGSLRYQRDNKGINTSSADVAGTQEGPSSAYNYVIANVDWHDITYQGTIEYDVAPQSMLYASYATGYQPGTLDAMTTTGTEKMTLEQVTLGIKNRFFDNRLQVNVEAFNSQYHNRSLQGTLNTSLSTTDNTVTCPGQGATSTVVSISDTNACVNYPSTPTIPDLLSRGVDLEVNWLPSSKDRVDFTAEYLESVYSSAPDVPAYTAAQLLSLAGVASPTSAQSTNADTLASYWNSLVQSYKGLTLQNSPKWSLNATYQHIFDLAGGSTLTPSINGVYKTRYWTQGGGPGANIANPGNSYQEAYNMFNVYLAWASADGKFNVNGYVKNIENEPIMVNYGTTYVTLDAPRTFGVSFSASL
ncbi:MAG: TonB-dependent receptor [Steroidobacteraceae bacterium]